MNLRDQVELLKRDNCSLFREREKLSAKLMDLTRGGREEELREELCKSREKWRDAGGRLGLVGRQTRKSVPG